jgi:hypothetical protein
VLASDDRKAGRGMIALPLGSFASNGTPSVPVSKLSF